MEISVLLAGDLEFRSAVNTALDGKYSVVEVDSVHAAADALLAAKPYLACIDLRSSSMAGTAICRRIKGAAATRLLPILACADPGQEALISALDAGADHVLAYPPPAGELQAKM